MREKTIEDVIATIQFSGKDKNQLLKFNVSLKMRENTLMDVIAAMNVGGKIFDPTRMLETLNKEVAQKDVEIKDLKQKILENRRV